MSIRYCAVALALTVAVPANAQLGGLSGMLGGLGGIGKAGPGNAAGLLGYCVKNKLTGGAAAQGVLGKLTGQPTVTGTPDYKQGLLGQVTGQTAAAATPGKGLSLGSLPAGVKTRACDLVLKRAGVVPVNRVAFLAGLTILAAPVAAQDGGEAAAMMRALGGGGLSGKKLTKAIAKADAHPLGSERNPVRADGVGGQHAYLRRLRCGDGAAPTYTRAGSMGDGPYRYIVDNYQVTCAGAAPVTVIMDLYHRNAVETRPVAGFTIVADTPS